MRPLPLLALVLLLVAPASAQTTRPAAWQLGPFERVDHANPLITPNKQSRFDCPLARRPVAWESDHTFNPAAVTVDGTVHLLYRAEDDSGTGIAQHTSRLGYATSRDGVTFDREPAPAFFPADDAERAREWPGGVEDPRLVCAPDGTVVLTYTQWDRKVPRLAVATTRDFKTWTKHGPAFAGSRFADTLTKSGAIVTKLEAGALVAARIDGKFWMYFGEAGMAVATSDDLLHWTVVTNPDGSAKLVLPTRPGKFDSVFAEGGPPAVLTDQGIVVIYNGKNADDGTGDPKIAPGTYCGGQALFDARDPTKLVDRADAPFFVPERAFEKTGQYAQGTVFVEGLTYLDGRWFLYYGTADSFVGVARTR